MHNLLILISLLGTAFAAGFSYLNPAGVTYSSTAYGNLAYRSLNASPYGVAPLPPPSYVASPLAHAAYSSIPLSTTSYTAPISSYASTHFVTSPLATIPFTTARFAAAPLATARLTAAPLTPTPIATAHISKVVPAVQHIPAVADIPVTKIEAQPAVIQNLVDVVQPKVATRRYEIRRPAIQKQFFDVEERLIVKPAGSAVVELEQPLSASQQGPTKVSPAYPAPSIGASYIPAVASHIPVSAQIPAVAAQIPVTAPIQSAPLPQPFPLQPSQQETTQQQQPQQEQQSLQDDSESVSVENPELGRFRILQNQEEQQQQSQLNSLLALRSQIQESSSQKSDSRSALFRQQFSLRPEQGALFRTEQQSSSTEQGQSNLSEPRPQPSQSQSEQFRSIELNSARNFEASDIVPSFRNISPEENALNQQKLIELLTARGPVAELRSVQETPQVRARVISVTAAPPTTGEERVNTRRIVVNRPIQTVQEVDVVEPFTKLERIAVHQPAVIKSAQLGVSRVPTSIPIQTYAHAHFI